MASPPEQWLSPTNKHLVEFYLPNLEVDVCTIQAKDLNYAVLKLGRLLKQEMWLTESLGRRRLERELEYNHPHTSALNFCQTFDRHFDFEC